MTNSSEVSDARYQLTEHNRQTACRIAFSCRQQHELSDGKNTLRSPACQCSTNDFITAHIAQSIFYVHCPVSCSIGNIQQTVKLLVFSVQTYINSHDVNEHLFNRSVACFLYSLFRWARWKRRSGNIDRLVFRSWKQITRFRKDNGKLPTLKITHPNLCSFFGRLQWLITESRYLSARCPKNCRNSLTDAHINSCIRCFEFYNRSCMRLQFLRAVTHSMAIRIPGAFMMLNSIEDNTNNDNTAVHCCCCDCWRLLWSNFFW